MGQAEINSINSSWWGRKDEKFYDRPLEQKLLYWIFFRFVLSILFDSKTIYSKKTSQKKQILKTLAFDLQK